MRKKNKASAECWLCSPKTKWPIDQRWGEIWVETPAHVAAPRPPFFFTISQEKIMLLTGNYPLTPTYSLTVTLYMSIGLAHCKVLTSHYSPQWRPFFFIKNIFLCIISAVSVVENDSSIPKWGGLHHNSIRSRRYDPKMSPPLWSVAAASRNMHLTSYRVVGDTYNI